MLRRAFKLSQVSNNTWDFSEDEIPRPGIVNESELNSFSTRKAMKANLLMS